MHALRFASLALLLSTYAACSPPVTLPDVVDVADGDASDAIDDATDAADAPLDTTTDAPVDAPPVEARVIAASRDGRIASLDIASPWAVRAHADTHFTMASVRCRAGRCVVVHPAPANMLTVVDAHDLSLLGTIALDPDADPRDVAFTDDHSIVVSRYGRDAMLTVDLDTRVQSAVDVSSLADSDGLPEMARLASCGRRVFAQMLRIDHATGAASALAPVIAVIDLDRTGADRIVGSIDLAQQPAFDMPVDCATNTLHVAEPRPLMQGGSRIQRVDLAARTASDISLDVTAELGGFEVVGENLYWIITHTEFGPGPSSHLNYTGDPSMPTYNTFAAEHVNDVAYDSASDQLFYPDPCISPPTAPCTPTVVPFHAHTGARASTSGIDVGFPAIEITIAR